MDALGPVVVGGLLALIGGLVGAFIQAGREHRKWLRERRLDAYLKFLAIEHHITVIGADLEMVRTQIERETGEARAHAIEHVKELVAKLETLGGTLPEHVTPILLLGPKSVSDASENYLAAGTSALNGEAHKNAERVLIATMRKAIRVTT